MDRHPKLPEIFDEVVNAYRIYSIGDYSLALQQCLITEAKQELYEDEYDKLIIRYYVAPLLIDVGSALQNTELIERAVKYLHEWMQQHEQAISTHDFYNIANGYSVLSTLQAPDKESTGEDDYNFSQARHYFRKAISALAPKDYERDLPSEIWTNYGSCLLRASRTLEAIDAFNEALKINPTMGMALGFKGITLGYLASITRGYTHAFYLEAIKLLELAIEQQLEPGVGPLFQSRLDYLIGIRDSHKEMLSESITRPQAQNDFQDYLWQFSAQHRLFLNPAAFLDEKLYFGDPIFITAMYADINDNFKFDRYITFFNEIKQDYVLGRYMLAQSQHASEALDAADEDVTLYYPFDGSLQSIYIQMLKAAHQQAIAVLDKVAFFVYDYCKLQKPKPKFVSFRDLWADNNAKMRPELLTLKSEPLYSLFTLSRDVSKEGDWATIYEYRNAIAHRFLVVNGSMMPHEGNSDIPRVMLREFVNNTILAFQIARASIVYLVQFIEEQENRARGTATGKTITVTSPRIDKLLRYRP